MKVLFAQTCPSTTSKPSLGDLSVWPDMVPGTGTELDLSSMTQPLPNTPEAQQEGRGKKCTALLLSSTASLDEQQTLVSRDTNPALFTALNKETQNEKENVSLCLKLETFFMAEVKWLWERWMESLTFTSGNKEKIPAIPNWRSMQLLLVLISSKTHTRVSTKQMSQAWLQFKPPPCRASESCCAEIFLWNSFFY